MAGDFMTTHLERQIGHVPVAGVCKACALETDDLMPHEPCPEQKFARALVDAGYRALPSSEDEFLAMVKEARNG